MWQVLEGHEKDVMPIWESIQNDGRHAAWGANFGQAHLLSKTHSASDRRPLPFWERLCGELSSDSAATLVDCVFPQSTVGTLPTQLRVSLVP